MSFAFFNEVDFRSRVEASITDHLRYFPPNMEKYKAMQIFHMKEDRNQEDCKLSVILFSKLKISVNL